MSLFLENKTLCKQLWVVRTYGIGTNQYGTKEEAEAAHSSAPKYNLTTGQKIMGGTAAALPAAWSMLHSLSSDDQGDLFSAAGRGAMGGIAARSAANSAGLESGALSAGAKLDPALAHLGQKWTNWRDSTAGSTSGKVGEDNVDAAYGIQSNNDPDNNDPQQTTLNQYGKFTNPMHNESKQITAEEAQKEGVKSSGMAHGERSVSAVEEAAVDTGEKIMGASAQEGLTAEEAKKKVVKSRRPWSYY